MVQGVRRYAAVWVVDDRRWDWAMDIGFEDLRERLHDFPGRLVSLDPFTKALRAALRGDLGRRGRRVREDVVVGGGLGR